jgi:hypothetical protein
MVSHSLRQMTLRVWGKEWMHQIAEKEKGISSGAKAHRRRDCYVGAEAPTPKFIRLFWLPVQFFTYGF